MIQSDGHTGIQFKVLRQGRVTVTELEKADGEVIHVFHLEKKANQRLEPILWYLLFDGFRRCPLYPERECYYFVPNPDADFVRGAEELEKTLDKLDVLWPEVENKWREIAELGDRLGRRMPFLRELLERAFI